MKYSILIPSRCRIRYLDPLLRSIIETTKNKKEVEVHVAFDDDDFQTITYVANFQQLDSDLQIYFHIRPRSVNINGDYYNWMATNFAKGEHIIISNDDCIFLMPEWDEKATKKIDDFISGHTHGIVYGIIEDKEREPKRNDSNYFSCFPLVSKKAVDILGYVFMPEYQRDGADWVLARLYREFGAIVDLRDCIIIEHISVRSGRRPKDEFYNEHVSLCQSVLTPPRYDVITRDLKILNHFCYTGEIINAYDEKVQFNDKSLFLERYCDKDHSPFNRKN